MRWAICILIHLVVSAVVPVLAEDAAAFGPVEASGLKWTHLSSANGTLPVPGESLQQTGALVADLDKSGVPGFVVSFRQKAPALVWYRRHPGAAEAWDRIVIDKDFLTVEAGGVVCDVDGDGYPDVIFGADWQGAEMWWWRNPGPPGMRRNRGSAIRHSRKAAGTSITINVSVISAGTGKPQLSVFWNQGAHTLFLADIPADPRHAGEWPMTPIFTGNAVTKGGVYAEGCAACDIDGDGKLDILAGNYWFKHVEGNTFKAIRSSPNSADVSPPPNCLRTRNIRKLVINSGDGVGPLQWYECVGDPQNEKDWKAHELVAKATHGRQACRSPTWTATAIWTSSPPRWPSGTRSRFSPTTHTPKAWIFFGDGKGNFRKTVFATGIGFHEAKLADFNGDGKIDILSKPYNWQVPRDRSLVAALTATDLTTKFHENGTKTHENRFIGFLIAAAENLIRLDSNIVSQSSKTVTGQG